MAKDSKETKKVSKPVSTGIEESLFPDLTQNTLYLTAFLVIIGMYKITDDNIRILYSLAMIIASSVGKYGSESTHYLKQYAGDEMRLTRRILVYNILWFFGICGIIL